MLMEKWKPGEPIQFRDPRPVWRYMLRHYVGAQLAREGGSYENDIEDMNQLGEAGWELVSVWGDGGKVFSAAFKRLEYVPE